jgi:transglutaminase-like putative cysteine protease
MRIGRIGEAASRRIGQLAQAPIGRRCSLGWIATWLVLTLPAVGCQSAEPPAARSGETLPAASHPKSAPTPPPTSTAATAPKLDKDYWDALMIENSHVGYAHTTYRSTSEQGRLLMQIESESELTVQRFGQTIKQRMNIASLETADGAVVRCSNKLINETSAKATVEIATDARVERDRLLLSITTHGKTETATLPWETTWGGYFATEQTLERQPMKPGEKRRLRALLAGFNQLADVSFHAIRYESTELLEGSLELLRIEAQVTVGGTTLDQVVWTDQSGQTRKTWMAALNQTAYRTTRENAMRRAQGDFDLGEKTVVRLETSLSDPHHTRQVRYRVRLSRGTPAEAFSSGRTQRVQAVDAQVAEITVRALRPTDELGTEFPADLPPGAGDSAANSLVQSDDAQVVALARRVAPKATDAWEIALALEKHVSEYVDNKSFAQALASAADVVRSREGDCTEHAVLLAALLRARNLPARVAIGLVYSPVVGGFAYHMWTETWIQNRWVPLDATLGQGGIGAAHLKVSHSDLRGVDPFSQFLPVLQLIGNLKIEILSADPA